MMKLFDRLQTVDYLIRIRGTGTPKALAHRLRISQRQWYEFLNLMKKLGAPIEYDRHKETYFYSVKGGFNIRFTPTQKVY